MSGLFTFGLRTGFASALQLSDCIDFVMTRRDYCVHIVGFRGQHRLHWMGAESADNYRLQTESPVKNSLCSLALAAAMLVAAPLAHATLIQFNFNLSGANEVPATATSGTGVVQLVLDTVAQTLQGHIVFSGLTGTTTAAHIHCCLASPFLTGVNVGVATLLPAFPGFPLGVTSGTDDFLLDLSSASSYNPAFVTMQGTLANAEAAFIAALIAGQTYLNIHTNVFPGGEIRGFVSILEPMTTSLLLLGLAAAAFVSRRRRRI